jgi:protein-disulfide isomerase
MSGKTPSDTGTTAPSVTPSTNGSTSQTLSPDRIEKLLSDAVIEGGKNADIIVVEYSDMECPFCVRQYHETKLEPKLLAQYGEKVQFAFKNNR